MDASMQTFCLPSARDVTLNIGLGKGHGHTVKTVPHRLRTLTKLLPQVMEPGYIGHLHLTPTRIWVGEPMAIVQGTFKPDVHRHMMLWDSVLEMEQDCIAIYSHTDEVGGLFGPRAEQWAPFNINLFTFLGDTQ